MMTITDSWLALVLVTATTMKTMAVAVVVVVAVAECQQLQPMTVAQSCLEAKLVQEPMALVQQVLAKCSVELPEWRERSPH